MNKLIRKTITIPENIYRQAKITASFSNESFSSYITNILSSQIRKRTKIVKIKDPFKTMGTLSVGINKKWKRKDIYEDYLRRKIRT